MADHLPIQRVGADAPRRVHGGGRGYRDPDRNRSEFVRLAQDELTNAERRRQRRRQQLTHIDPDLIFRFTLNQPVQENTFMASLRAAGIEVLAAQPRRDGYFLGLAADGNITRLRERLSEYARADAGAFVRAIDAISEIPVEEKIGPRLANAPAQHGELVTVDIETLRLPDAKMNSFIRGLHRQMQAFGGRVLDEFVWTGFAIIKVRCPIEHVRVLAEAPQVLYIDLPPPPLPSPRLTVDFRPGAHGVSPRDDAPGVLVCDSGVVSAHPLLSACVRSEKTYLGDGTGSPADDTGHGTSVAGVAAFGDFIAHIENGNFPHTVWIHSARVLHDDGHGHATWDDDKIFEKQLKEAIEFTVDAHPSCRVVNLSLGDPDRRMLPGHRQLPLAYMLDGLARALDIVIVVSAGNYERETGEAYPQYLHDDLDRTKIANPASAALALTIGAYYRQPQRQMTLLGAEATWDYPAHYTRVGPGLSGMMKPELIEFGGEGGTTAQRNVITLNRDFLRDGRHFYADFGTSFSAPRVAHTAARIFGKYPNASANLAKALLLLSGNIPEKRPAPLDGLRHDVVADAKRLHNIYGYGIPDHTRSIESEDRRVVFIAEDEITLNGIHLYDVIAPPDFWTAQGDRTIDIALCHDPRVDMKRRDYFGCTTEFRLFKNTDIETVRQILSNNEENDDEPEAEDEEASTPEALKQNLVNVTPGSSIRNKGAHQRGTWRMLKRPTAIDPNKSVVIAVINRKKWETDTTVKHPYALAIQFEHRSVAGLYPRMRALNRVQARARLQV